MSSLATMGNLIRGEQHAAKGKVREVARRDSQGHGKPGDAKALPKLLADAGMEASEYAAMVDLYRRVDRLQDEAAKAAECEQKMAKLAGERRALRDKLRQLSEETNQKIAEINAQIGNAEHDLQLAQEARAELEVLRQEYPAELETEPLDLDKFTLTNQGSMINMYDPSAPVLHVNDHVFRRENHRRHAIMRVARERAIEEYRRNVAQHAENIRLGHRAKPPERVLPTWADTVKGGIEQYEVGIEKWEPPKP